MKKMIYGSILFSRIVNRSQLVASYVFKTRSNPKNLFHSSTRTRSSRSSLLSSQQNQSEEDNLKPENEHQSRLSSFYDEIFEVDPPSSPSSSISSSTAPSPSPVYPNFDELDLDDLNSEFDSQSNSFQDPFNDDTYPQGLPFEKTTPQAPRKTSVVEPTFISKTKPMPSYTDTPRFPPKKATPQKASNVIERRSGFPPPVLEYDNSHYDPEFGGIKPEEVTYNEFHEGMMDMTSTENPLLAKEHDIKARKQPRISITLPSKASETKTNIDNENYDVESPSPEPAQNVLKIKVTPQEEGTKVFESTNGTQSKIQFSTSFSGEKLEYVKAAQNGNAVTSNLSVMKEELVLAKSEIFKLNKNKEFNVNSPRQVSKVLFGIETESTNKDALEAIVGSNSGGNGKIAELVLKIRKLARDINRFEKKEESKAAGTQVQSVNTQTDKPRISKGSQSSNAVFNDGAVETNDALVLVDASAFIFRAYFSMPPIHRRDGMPTGATLGFCNMINRLVLNQALQGQEPRVVLVFDSKDGTNLRKELYPEYKSNRKRCPEDLVPQFDFVRNAATAYGIAQVEAPSYEADDVIATLTEMAKEEKLHVNILSGDKDLMQLVSLGDESNVHVIDPVSMVRYQHDSVEAKWGVKPELLGDLLALAGDSADNIPGVPGIGPKIAANLLQEYGSLEGLLENVDNIKQKGRRQKIKENTELAILSRQLVELERKIPIHKMTLPDTFQSINDFRMEPINGDRLLGFYDEMEFRDMKRRITDRLRFREQSTSVDESARNIFDKDSSSILNGAKNKRKQDYKRSKTGNGFKSPRKFQKPPPDSFDDVPF